MRAAVLTMLLVAAGCLEASGPAEPLVMVHDVRMDAEHLNGTLWFEGRHEPGDQPAGQRKHLHDLELPVGRPVRLVATIIQEPQRILDGGLRLSVEGPTGSIHSSRCDCQPGGGSPRLATVWVPESETLQLEVRAVYSPRFSPGGDYKVRVDWEAPATLLPSVPVQLHLELGDVLRTHGDSYSVELRGPNGARILLSGDADVVYTAESAGSYTIHPGSAPPGGGIGATVETTRTPVNAAFVPWRIEEETWQAVSAQDNLWTMEATAPWWVQACAAIELSTDRPAVWVELPRGRQASNADPGLNASDKTPCITTRPWRGETMSGTYGFGYRDDRGFGAEVTGAFFYADPARAWSGS